jgi:hypothetical protein
MEKNNVITMDKAKQTGYNLSRISYDTRHEINAKVIGVLKYNNEIREKLLKRNIGMYSQSNLHEGIGYISNLYSLESSKPLSLGEDGLLGYTHVFKSDYQSDINKKYDIGDNVAYYQHGSLPDTNFLKWNGKYTDYTEYINNVIGVPANLGLNFLTNTLSGISDVFGTQTQMDKVENFVNKQADKLSLLSSLNDILQYDNIKYAMEKTRIGTISPNPIAAFSGAVTTNINNFSGTDTNLGLITNYLYASTLNNAAHFNSLRKTKYITPNAYASIGNKLATMSLIGSDFKIDDETGRIIANFGGAATTINYENKKIEDYTNEVGEIDPSRDIADSKHARYKNLITNWGQNKNYYSPLSSLSYDKKNNINNHLPLFKSFFTHGATNNTHNAFYIWNEGTYSFISQNLNSVNGFGTYKGIPYVAEIDGKEIANDILYKTQELFARHKIDTLVGRFHTELKNSDEKTPNLLQSAVSEFGLSHGRNLLTRQAFLNKKSDTVINGYDNPYCRTWTYHHQYDNIARLIRPFAIETVAEDEGQQSKTNILSTSDLQNNWIYGRTPYGPNRLQSYSSINRNGFVNITPHTNGGNVSDVKQCMFSIENLAWMDVPDMVQNLSKEQRGPHGGRIMWFPPYDLKFNENVNVNWGQAEFIGRGEKIYTYTNTERSGTLSFILLVDHPSILDAWKKSRPNGEEDRDEQTLLRFFAGCEVLNIDGEVNRPDIQIPITIKKPSLTSMPPDNRKKICFNIFFPHNYSGYNDSLNEAITYLSEKYEADPQTKGNTENDEIKYKVDKDSELIDTLGDNKKSDGMYKGWNKFVLPKENDKGGETHSFQEIVQKGKEIIEHYNITSVVIDGYEIESQEKIKNTDKKRNDRDNLCERRAIFAKKFVKKKLDIDDDKIEIKNTRSISVSTQDSSNISSSNVKLNRCAKVTIYYEDLKQLLCDELTEWLKTVKQLDDAAIQKLTYEELEKYRKEKEKTEKKAAKKAAREERKQNKKAAREERKHIRKCEKKHPKIDDCDEFLSTIEERNNPPKKESTKPTLTEAMNAISKRGTRIDSNSKVIDGYTKEVIDKSKYKRWEDEAKYFELLQDNDSFLYSRIVDKIKYFSPAFHSITPEGFNARLAFLHQCTRQGGTYSVSDKPSLKSAGNLAFGRPPICILRIGDFYHTKIVIDSITIDYENPQWDINPEGIGMQPMFARISLNFKFLGGSDIEAPISRLQNAISFNYYANQSIYDDRADRGEYSANYAGNKIKGLPWKPIENTNKKQ